MGDWNTIETCPWMKPVLVKNDIMDRPVIATRGYVSNGAVNPDRNLFTLVKDTDEVMPLQKGSLVCPTVWKEID